MEKESARVLIHLSGKGGEKDLLLIGIGGKKCLSRRVCLNSAFTRLFFPPGSVDIPGCDKIRLAHIAERLLVDRFIILWHLHPFLEKR